MILILMALLPELTGSFRRPPHNSALNETNTNGENREENTNEVPWNMTSVCL